YYTPNGRDINHMGIVPDRVVELTKEDLEKLNKNRDLVGTVADPQFAKAIDILSSELKYGSSR
ncbi:MAG: peptidase S41, partial [Pseudanabaena sp.]